MLARPADEITVADVIRALEGPLASVRGIRPHELADAGEQEPFISLWVAVRAALRGVLEHVTIGDLAAGALPPDVAAMVADPDAWDPHTSSMNLSGAPCRRATRSELDGAPLSRRPCLMVARSKTRSLRTPRRRGRASPATSGRRRRRRT